MIFYYVIFYHVIYMSTLYELKHNILILKLFDVPESCIVAVIHDIFLQPVSGGWRPLPVWKRNSPNSPPPQSVSFFLFFHVSGLCILVSCNFSQALHFSLQSKFQIPS